MGRPTNAERLKRAEKRMKLAINRTCAAGQNLMAARAELAIAITRYMAAEKVARRKNRRKKNATPTQKN